jgi:hypothetical protein
MRRLSQTATENVDRYCLESYYFHVINVLSNGSQFNAYHSVSAILQSLPDWRVSEVGAIDRKLLMLVDNA